MAAPTPKFTPEQVASALNQSRGLQFLAAKTLGCSQKTIERYIKKYRLCGVAYRQKRGEALDHAEEKLYDAVEAGEAWAVCFMLKTIGKKRGYVERQEHEHAGKDGKPLIAVTFVEAATDASPSPDSGSDA